MAQPAGTFSQYNAVGNREDLSSIVYDTSPTKVPVFSALPKAKATAVNHEWQTRSLAAATAANAVIEGDDASNDTQTANVRLGNRTQLMDKVIQVSSTQQSVKTAGTKSQMAGFLEDAINELKRDIETALCDNGASVVGNNTTARELAGFPAWLDTNTSSGTGGADPVTIGSTARTDGTQRAFTESLLLDVHQLCYTNGGDPRMLVVGPFNARQISSTFTGGSTRVDKSEDKKLFATVEMYISPFGELKVVPDRFSRGRDALLIDPEYAAVAYLQPFKTEDLAKTGHSIRKMLSVELTLEVRNEKAHGIVADLTVS